MTVNKTAKPSFRVVNADIPDQPEKKTDWNKVDLSIRREGKQITLPNDPQFMKTGEAIAVLQRVQKDEEATYEINETIPGFFYDGLVAFAKALKEIYGFAQATHVTVNTFFGKMKNPPQIINVRVGTGPDDIVPVPYGSFQIPGVEGTVETGITMSGGVPSLELTGEIKKKHADVVHDLVKMAKWFSQNDSIYSGKAITLHKAQNPDNLDFSEQIPFFNPFLGNEVTIFTKEIEDLIDVSILTPIKKTNECRAAGVPLRRGILLEGPYGTGKTLTARMTARACMENGWTFVHVTSASAFKSGLQFARYYQPAVVFCEDIDHLVANRGDKANDLINEIDGVVGKGDAIMVVFTTNFVEKIDKALLRPGRLDTVVSLRPPKADAVERLIRHYAGTKLDPSSDLADVSETIAGTNAIPATIREIVERSKLAAIAYDRKNITAADLAITADGMANHMNIIERAVEGREHVPTLDVAMMEMVVASVKKALGR